MNHRWPVDEGASKCGLATSSLEVRDALADREVFLTPLSLSSQLPLLRCLPENAASGYSVAIAAGRLARL